MTRKIFVVEDDDAARWALCALIGNLPNARVTGFASEESAALTWLISKPEKWDAAIVDLLLTRGSGLRVLAGCRVRRTAQKIVVLANYADKEMRRRCADLGADAVYDKATELEQLLDFLHRPSLRWAQQPPIASK